MSALSVGERIARAVGQKMAPQLVQDVQRLLSSVAPQDASIDAIPLALLGGLTLQQARAIYSQIASARLSRKNLWYIRIKDENPPDIGYEMGDGIASTFNLFATEVSYGPSTITGEKVAIGASMMDRITGTEQVDIQITSMDDESGTLKRWFDGKCGQLAHGDGTFGLPYEYCVDIEVVHAVPSPDVQVNKPPYKAHYRMRPVSVTHELSRRDQALFEMQMSFTQFDTFMPV